MSLAGDPMKKRPDTGLDRVAWQRKAMAFATRSHRHLWGKNNEDPLVFLFRQGLTHEFSKQIYLGWNKFGQERPYIGWGMDRTDKFLIPSGIVFPHIVDKTLLSVFVISMDAPESVFMVPGSAGFPVVLGDPGKDAVVTDDMLKGLVFYQDGQDSVKIIPASP